MTDERRPSPLFSGLYRFIGESVVVAGITSLCVADLKAAFGPTSFRAGFAEAIKSPMTWGASIVAAGLAAFAEYRGVKKLYEEKAIADGLLKQQGIVIQSYREIDPRSDHAAKLKAEAPSSEPERSR